MESIFGKVRLRPFQARTVAQRRFDDAKALQKTGRNRHANGAMYLGGFVIECLLKARLLKKHKWLQSPTVIRHPSANQAELLRLCYQSHDLEKILTRLPEVSEGLRVAEQRGSGRLNQSLKKVCTWTVYARYSPYDATMAEASRFLNQIEELKRWLS